MKGVKQYQTVLLCAFFLLIPAYIFAAPVKTIQFGDLEFHHAWENKGDSITQGGNLITQEYITEGDTLDQWKTILVYRIYPGIDNIDEVINQYFSQIRPAQPPNVYKNEEDENDQTFVFLVAAPERAYIEYVIHRFLMINDEVRSYQFAARAIGSDTNYLREEIIKNKARWLALVVEMTDADFNGE